MRTRSISYVLIWTAGLTASAIGLLTAVLQVKWVAPLVVGVAICLGVGRIVWRWQAGLLSDRLDLTLQERRSVPIILLLVSLPYHAVVVISLISYTLMKGPQPCLCHDPQRMHTWVQLLAGGAVLAPLEIMGLIGLVIAVYGLTRERAH
jgi:hypothetical protein